MNLDQGNRDEQFEYREIGDWTTHKARTAKTCGFCGTSINPGQQYQKLAFVFEGEFSTAFRHQAGTCMFEAGDAPF